MHSEFVAVKATEERYRVLRHQPSGAGIDPGTGRGMWPADQFTWALRDEGSIRIVDAAAPGETDHDDANRATATAKSRRA